MRQAQRPVLHPTQQEKQELRQTMCQVQRSPPEAKRPSLDSLSTRLTTLVSSSDFSSPLVFELPVLVLVGVDPQSLERRRTGHHLPLQVLPFASASREGNAKPGYVALILAVELVPLTKSHLSWLQNLRLNGFQFIWSETLTVRSAHTSSTLLAWSVRREWH